MTRLVLTNLPFVLTFAIALWKPRSMERLTGTASRCANAIPKENVRASNVTGKR